MFVRRNQERKLYRGCLGTKVLRATSYMWIRAQLVSYTWNTSHVIPLANGKGCHYSARLDSKIVFGFKYRISCGATPEELFKFNKGDFHLCLGIKLILPQKTLK